ncbi:MAG: hypothetical protein V1911_02470, partial [Candidatus Micrarchaeota archaeon]
KLRKKLEKTENPRRFEEALLRFFAPYGVISKNAGVGGFENMEEITKKYNKVLPEMNLLAPHLKGYFSNIKNESVLDFLESRKVLK